MVFTPVTVFLSKLVCCDYQYTDFLGTVLHFAFIGSFGNMNGMKKYSGVHFTLPERHLFPFPRDCS
jgi:hypothetical protein